MIAFVGQKQEIEKGNVVLTGDGLVGRIASVGVNAARILLIARIKTLLRRLDAQNAPDGENKEEEALNEKVPLPSGGSLIVEAGQLILVNLDRVLGNDITSPVAIREFNKLNKDNVFDKDKVTMVMDHFAPNKDIKAATQCKMCRDFCGEKEITHFYNVIKCFFSIYFY